MDRCEGIVSARCVRMGNRDLPEWSELTGRGTLWEALDELYVTTDELNTASVLGSGTGCITMSGGSAGAQINQLGAKICELLEGVTELRGQMGNVGRCLVN
jgi:hypothetical protein